MLQEIDRKDKKVEYVPIEYSRTIELVRNGDIDATIMNVDEILDKKDSIHFVDIEGYGAENTEAVIVASKEREEIRVILDKIIDIDTVLNIQKLILDDKIIPRY